MAPIEKKEFQMLSDEFVKKYVDSGMEPVPEQDFRHSITAFDDATINKLLEREPIYSYFNHRAIWEDMHKQECFNLKVLWGRFASDVEKYVRYKLGLSPNATSVPDRTKSNAGPAMILSSGCSLEQALPLLHKWKGGIFCSSSHAATLMYYDAPPTHIVHLDSSSNWGEMAAKKWNYKKTVMITHPGIEPELNQNWKGQKYYYRILDPYYEFYNRILPSGYYWIDSESFPFGSTVPTEMGMARRLGYSPLILIGADSCYGRDGRSRFDSWAYDKIKRKWMRSPGSHYNTFRDKVVLIKTPSGRITQFVLLHYRKAIGALAWLDELNMIDCSDGILTGLFPKADIKEVIETQGRCCESLMKTGEEIRDNIGPWLALQNTFWLPLPEGHKLTSIPNWQTNINSVLTFIKTQTKFDIDVEAIAKECEDLYNKGKERDYGEATPVLPTNME